MSPPSTSKFPKGVAVPFFDLQKHHEPLADELQRAISRVVASHTFILGPEVAAFEAAVARAVGVRNAIGVSSGTDAIVAALLALGVGPGDEVVTTSFTFVATASAIVRAGATPVFVDIDPHSFNLRPDLVETALTPRTRAVVAVHLFGQMADVRGLRALCDRRGIALVEDAAQALFATRDGAGAGTVGHAGCFSFFPTKNLGALGDGGMVVTDDDALAERLRMVRGHGQRTRYLAECSGGNFRLDALQAAVLATKLPHVPRWMERRRANAARYRELLSASGVLISNDAAASDARVIVLPGADDGATHVWNQFVVRVRERDALRAHLADDGIGTEVYYPVPLPDQPAFKSGIDAGRAVRDGMVPACPEATRASREVLALPIFPELASEQLERVVASVVAFFEHGTTQRTSSRSP